MPNGQKSDRWTGRAQRPDHRVTYWVCIHMQVGTSSRTLASIAERADCERPQPELSGVSATRRLRVDADLSLTRRGPGLDTPGTPIKASDVAALRDIDLPVWTVLEVLAVAGVLEEDRTPTVDAWFERNIAGLPEAMSGELRTWFEIMKHGCAIPPRGRPRNETTIHVQLQWALPTLRTWATAGHSSLREISRNAILDALPPSGNPRAEVGQGLKSIFKLLKGQKVLFTDPMARLKTGYIEALQPLPVDVPALREAINSTDPAQALVVALFAFHGLRSGQLQVLQLTDIRDGRLHHAGRVIVLADLVRTRLRAYLDYRNARWPNSTNTYLFLHYRTAARTTEVGRRWIRLMIGPGLTPTSIREDRILDEARATDGDTRRIVDLFGLSIQAASRYTRSLEAADLAGREQPEAATPV